jgi:hypothetical protein
VNSESDWIDSPQFKDEEPTEPEVVENVEELIDKIEAKASIDFADLYGFEHDCHCAEDWKTGNTGMVSECYTQMCDDALNQCHLFKGEIAHLKRKVGVLRDQLREKGEEPRV